LVLAILMPSAFAYSQTRIGVVNAQEVIEDSKRGAQIQKELSALQKSKAAAMQVLQEDVKRLEKDLLSPALNAETREDKSEQLEQKRKTLQRTYEDAQRELQRETQEKLLELEKEIMPLIAQYGKAGGFAVIYDRARSGIVYFDEAIDITEDIIRAMDAQ